MNEQEGTQGQPGQAGQAGAPPGGTGGRGGRGGAGRRGQRGRPGRPSIFPLIGYLILVLGIMAGFYQQYEISQRNAKAITVLCTQNRTLGARIRASEDFLRANPNGVPGISAAVIRRGLRTSRDEKRDIEKTLKGECRDERRP